MTRFDSFGLFWEDQPRERAARGSGTPAERTIPPIPETGWCAPHEFPRLDAAKELVIDVETYDPNLMTHGPGWPTGDGHIVGLAVGTDDGCQFYLPMRHEYGGGNMDPEMVLKWAREELTRDSQSKYGANLLYDIGWLGTEGVDVQGKLIDVQFAEPLLNEHAFSYALGSLAEQYLNETKVEDELYTWLQRAYGGREGRKQAGNIYRSPVALCGPYAQSDVDLPYRIYQKQKPLLEQQGLMGVMEMECDLIYQLVAMRRKGVRVDVEGAEQTREKFLEREAILQIQLDKFSGRTGFSSDASTDMKAAFDILGLEYPQTAAGNPSFAKDVLEGLDHPFTKAILEKRKLSKARGTFIEGYILDKNHNGRVHPQLHPLKRDDGGTVSGRMSSSHPNIQNIPARDEEIKKLIRGMFLPEPGCEWFAPDYSQIEYRMFAHYAGDDKLIHAYQDPSADFHNVTGELLGGGLPRPVVKNFNFMLLYGGGKKKLASMLRENLTETEAQEILYDAKSKLDIN